MSRTQTQFHNYLEGIGHVCDRIREGLRPEPLSDDTLDRIPHRIQPIGSTILPDECTPRETPRPCDLALAYVTGDMQRATMYAKMHRTLVDGDILSAAALTMDGYISIDDARDFLHAMADRGVIEKRGTCDVYVDGAMHRLTTWRDAAMQIDAARKEAA